MSLRILGVPKESWAKECRVACSPAVAGTLTKKGFTVEVEKGAGAAASFRDLDYEAAGAKIVDRNAAFQADIVLKLRQPSLEETKLFREDGILYSFLYPKQNKVRSILIT